MSMIFDSNLSRSFGTASHQNDPLGPQSFGKKASSLLLLKFFYSPKTRHLLPPIGLKA